MDGDRRSDPVPVAVPVPAPPRPGPALTQLHEMRVREGPGGVGTAQQQDAAGQEEAAESHAAAGPLPVRAQLVPAGQARRSARAGPARGLAGSLAPFIPLHPSPPSRSPLSRARPPPRLQQRQLPRCHGGPAARAGRPEVPPEVPCASARASGALRRPEVGGGAASARAPAKMAPLDLDKYVEIARLCKYLPENDLKVRPRRRGRDQPGRAGAGAGATGRAGAGGAGGPGADPDPASLPPAAPL